MSDQYDIASENEAIPAGHRSGFIALVGRPNVGKSTLLNALLKQKIAIVTPRPQTTRIRQLGILTEPDYQIVFVDTPGLLSEPRHKLDEFMVTTAQDALRDADLVLWMVDVSVLPGEEDRRLAALLAALPQRLPIFIGLNKADLLTNAMILPHVAGYQSLLPTAGLLRFSALTGEGCADLLTTLVANLPEGPRFFPEDKITETYLRDIAAELVREQIMLQLRDEVPYGTAVTVTEYKERENDVTYIRATIFVERPTHKRILIGSKGQQLQQIGAAARKEIEELIEGKVFLDLWVKVAPKWRQDERALNRFGYRKLP